MQSTILVCARNPCPVITRSLENKTILLVCAVLQSHTYCLQRSIQSIQAYFQDCSRDTCGQGTQAALSPRFRLPQRCWR